MFGLGTSELIVIGIVAAILLRSQLPARVSSILKSIKAYRAGLEELCRRDERNQLPRITSIELITEQRDTTMKDRWQKFLWSPAFWATLGVFGCATGLYFQGVANNGSGLWCLGLVFLGAAYIEKNP